MQDFEELVRIEEKIDLFKPEAKQRQRQRRRQNKKTSRIRMLFMKNLNRRFCNLSLSEILSKYL